VHANIPKYSQSKTLLVPGILDKEYSASSIWAQKVLYKNTTVWTRVYLGWSGKA
jgi:hypothetical protein